MTAKLLLRIAAILMLLHTLGHTIGAITWKDAPNPAVGQVINGMQSQHFDFMGRSVTLAGFFEGYGFIMIGVLPLVAIFLWLFGSQSANPLTKSLLPVLAVFLLVMGVIEYIYFFPFAAAFTFLAGLCSVIALVVIKRGKSTIQA
ncbi:LIC_13387 family protein [Mucilaginibacter ginsenosidivorax]|uniref:DoxX family protein n=1 Tax=Mucilaginibacter ginsenosidivorax TaxID=862126 RepID=A0A5B8W128_9SPHI|nr:hypothetical protein [Mucilaginibacter ginsenosidivorax]QEC77517.1 hypothetical protein FSB76_16795 [Mucilaginibacter ginsenosidivorax]